MGRVRLAQDAAAGGVGICALTEVDEHLVNSKRLTFDPAGVEWNRKREPRTGRQRQFAQFCRQHASWLDDYALFMALETENAGKAWWHWPQALWWWPWCR